MSEILHVWGGVKKLAMEAPMDRAARMEETPDGYAIRVTLNAEGVAVARAWGWGAP